MKIKRRLESNNFTNSIITQIRKVQYHILPVFISTFNFNIKKYLRMARINTNSPYESLRKIRNKHQGERCFIVATGPSLTVRDLEKLKNEVTFSMNSICLAFNETEWRPTYYGIQDIGVFNKLEQYIESLKNECIFIADVVANKKRVPDNYYVFPLNYLNHMSPHKRYQTKFSDDAFAVVYDGYSITYSLIQLAVYMGFNEIYLLGTDCNYSSDMHHHFKDYDHVDPTFLSAGKKMTSAYKEAKKYADRHDLKIFNATRGGKLEVFERVNLDFILSKT